jgi:hypothetical protein
VGLKKGKSEMSGKKEKKRTANTVQVGEDSGEARVDSNNKLV